MPTSSHDAATGFRDIKALPEFHPFPVESVLFLLLLILLGAACWYYLRSRRQKTPVAPPRPPHEVAVERLRTLEKRRLAGSIAVRDFGESLSFTVRTFLEQTLNFPAVELTSGEIVRVFPNVFNARFLDSTDAESYRTRIGELLRLCDRVMFAPDTEHTYSHSSAELAEVVSKAIHVVESLTKLLTERDAVQEETLREGGTP